MTVRPLLRESTALSVPESQYVMMLAELVVRLYEGLVTLLKVRVMVVAAARDPETVIFVV